MPEILIMEPIFCKRQIGFYAKNIDNGTNILCKANCGGSTGSEIRKVICIWSLYI